MCFHALIGLLRVKKKYTIGPNNVFSCTDWAIEGEKKTYHRPKQCI